MNGDVLTTLNFQDLIRAHQKTKPAATIAVQSRKIKIDFGVVDHNSANEIVGYNEKPSIDYCVSMGIYVFDPRVLPYIPEDQYFDFPELVQKLIDEGEKVISYPFDGYWQDLGNPEDYEQAIIDFKTMRPEFIRG